MCSGLTPLLEYILTALHGVPEKKRDLVIERIKYETNYLVDAISRDAERGFLKVFMKAKRDDFQVVEKYIKENSQYFVFRKIQENSGKNKFECGAKSQIVALGS